MGFELLEAGMVQPSDEKCPFMVTGPEKFCNYRAPNRPLSVRLTPNLVATILSINNKSSTTYKTLR
jgi:hypothetical protein